MPLLHLHLPPREQAYRSPNWTRATMHPLRRLSDFIRVTEKWNSCSPEGPGNRPSWRHVRYKVPTGCTLRTSRNFCGKIT